MMPRPPDFCSASHTYSLDGKPLAGVTTVLREAGLLVLNGPECRLRYARDRGSAVHLAIALKHAGTLDPSSVDEALDPYLFAFDRFRSDFFGAFTPELVERPICDPTLRLAGTPDVIGTLKLQGEYLALVDLKTGEPKPGHEAQVRAYMALARANAIPVVRGFVLYLRNDGTFKLHSCRDPHAETDWRASLHLYWRRRAFGAQP